MIADCAIYFGTNSPACAIPSPASPSPPTAVKAIVKENVAIVEHPPHPALVEIGLLKDIQWAVATAVSGVKVMDVNLQTSVSTDFEEHVSLAVDKASRVLGQLQRKAQTLKDTVERHSVCVCVCVCVMCVMCVCMSKKENAQLNFCACDHGYCSL